MGALADVLVLAGLGLLVVGTGLFSVPVAVLVAGLILIGVGVAVSRPKES